MTLLSGAVMRCALRWVSLPLSRRDRPRGADAIVVLGAPLLRHGGLGPVLRERVDAGVGLWRRGVAPVLCVTGGGPPGRAEAHAMAGRCRDLGVSEAALRIEDASRTTEENAAYCAELLRPAGVRSVCLVSQPFHLRRATLLFERAGFDAFSWHIDDSVQFEHPRLAARWVAREYAAWVYTAARLVGLAPHVAPRAYIKKNKKSS